LKEGITGIEGEESDYYFARGLSVAMEKVKVLYKFYANYDDILRDIGAVTDKLVTKLYDGDF
jgi:hypothetical protein